MNLLKTLAAISSMTMLSRVTGLLRESLFGAAFGNSAFTDAFNVAFRIPNLLRRLFAEGAFSQAFVPILSEYKNSQGEEATKSLIDHAATVLLWTTLLTAAIGIVSAPIIVYLMADGLEKTAGAFEESVWMTRLMFPYITCMSFVALAGGILNTWRQFKIPAFTPVLLNIVSICGALFLSHYFAQPIHAMAVAVVVGGLLQVGIQIPALMKIGMLPRISFAPWRSLQDSGVRRILGKMGPAVFAVSAAQFSLMINTNIAAGLAVGSISALTYADRLMEFPTAMLGVALSTILLPSLSKANVDQNGEEYSALLNWGMRLTFMLALPAAVGMATLAAPMIATLYHYNKFQASAIGTAAAPLVAYSVGLIGIIMVKILAPAFYARQDIRTPVRIAIGVMVVTQLLNQVFVPYFQVAGLALSIGVGASLNALFLYLGLRKLGLFTPQKGWMAFFAKLAVALAVMGALAWFGAREVDWVAMQAHPFQRAGLLFGLIGTCALAYFLVLLGLGFRLRDFKRSAR